LPNKFSDEEAEGIEDDDYDPVIQYPMSNLL